MRPPSVQSGQIYGQLTVIRYAGLRRSGKQNLRLFWCRCSCGNKVRVQGRLLKSGNSSSCGCRLVKYRKAMLGIPKSKHAANEQFGRLRLIEWSHTQGKAAYFRFQCACGALVTRSIQMVRSGKIRSCGCLRRETAAALGRTYGPRLRLPEGEEAFNRLLRTYRRSAKARHLRFELSRETFYGLTQKPCHYCGTLPYQVVMGSRSDYVYSGIDRVDSARGYTPENTVPCCWFCNNAKKTRTKEKFISWAKQIAFRAAPVPEDFVI